MPLPTEMVRLRTTNPLAQILEEIAPFSTEDVDALAGFRRKTDFERYEEKEKEIPSLIYEVLKKESKIFTKLVKRSYAEEEAWLVQVQCTEGEMLDDHAQVVYSERRNGERVPAFLEDEVIAHFVQVHVPRIFVRTLALPMVERNH